MGSLRYTNTNGSPSANNTLTMITETKRGRAEGLALSVGDAEQEAVRRSSRGGGRLGRDLAVSIDCERETRLARGSVARRCLVILIVRSGKRSRVYLKARRSWGEHAEPECLAHGLTRHTSSLWMLHEAGKREVGRQMHDRGPASRSAT